MVDREPGVEASVFHGYGNHSMSKAVKELIASDIEQRYAGVDSVCVVDLTGLNVPAQEQLRADLRAKSARMEVVRNSLARRAFSLGPLDPLGKVLQGPCALVTSSDSLIEAAQVLVETAKEFTTLTLKQAILEGDPQLLTVEEVARMKSRVELLGEVLMLLTSPGRAVAGCLSSPQARIAGCLQTIIDKAA